MYLRTRVRSIRKSVFVAGLLGLTAVTSFAIVHNLFHFLDPTGIITTYNANGGPIDESSKNPFFDSLGTNGRSCGTCHLGSDAMGLSVRSIQAKFFRTRGHDPLFAAFDGANCPDNTSHDPSAHSLLLKNGLIRIPIQLPATAQFKIEAYRDPHGCAIQTDSTTGVQTVSVYRRPLPTSNLRYLSAIMFDGRETISPLTDATTVQANMMTDLLHQSITATLTHAQAAQPPTLEQQTAIVNFELGLTSAQSFSFRAGELDAAGAQGGATNLSAQTYYPGTNDSLGADPKGDAFNSTAFTLYNSFDGKRRDARQDVAAGEKLFNTRALTISNVRGLNDNTALAKALGTTVPIPPFQGFCTTCHDTPNVGNHSLPLALDIGTGHDPTVESDPLIAKWRDPTKLSGPPDFSHHRLPRPIWRPTAPLHDAFRNSHYRSRQRPGQRLVQRRWTYQGPHPSRTRRPRSLLPQRCRARPLRAPGLLQPALPDESN